MIKKGRGSSADEAVVQKAERLHFGGRVSAVAAGRRTLWLGDSDSVWEDIVCAFCCVFVWNSVPECGVRRGRGWDLHRTCCSYNVLGSYTRFVDSSSRFGKLVVTCALPVAQHLSVSSSLFALGIMGPAKTRTTLSNLY